MLSSTKPRSSELYIPLESSNQNFIACLVSPMRGACLDNLTCLANYEAPL
jgi:hypothetical protein